MPKVSQLPDATIPLNGSEIVVLNQGGITKTAPASAIASALQSFRGARTALGVVSFDDGQSGDVSFSRVVFDTDSFFALAHPTVLTAPFDGYYQCDAQLFFGPHIGYPTQVFGTLTYNAVTTLSQFYVGADTLLHPTSGSIGSPWWFNRGDTVKLNAGVIGGPGTLAVALSMYLVGYNAVHPSPPPPPVVIPPTITSAAADTMTVGTAATFTVTATGDPTITFTQSGTLPTGITWTPPAIAGTPGVGTDGTYSETFTATNAGGSASQAFTLTVLPSGPTTLLYDTFTDTDGTLLVFHAMNVGPGWALWAGTWVIESDSATQTIASGQNYIYSDAGVADVTISVTYTPGATYDGALCFNVQDGLNCWLYSPDAADGNLRLFVQTAGSYVEVGNVALSLTPGTPYDLAVVTNGDSVSCYLDGTLQITYTAGGRAFKTETHHGLRCGADTTSFWNDFLVQN